MFEGVCKVALNVEDYFLAELFFWQRLGVYSACQSPLEFGNECETVVSCSPINVSD